MSEPQPVQLPVSKQEVQLERLASQSNSPHKIPKQFLIIILGFLIVVGGLVAYQFTQKQILPFTSPTPFSQPLTPGPTISSECQKDTNCLWVIRPSECCPCPEIASFQALASNPSLVQYQPGQDYSQLRDSNQNCPEVICAPCPPRDKISCQSGVCKSSPLDQGSGGEKVSCKEPRPEVCTMECVAQPPYICGSDGKSYCSHCQACAYQEVEWSVLQNKPCDDITPLKCLQYVNPCDPKSCDYDPVKCKSED